MKSWHNPALHPTRLNGAVRVNLFLYMKMTNMKHKVLGAIGLVIIGVLAYGYWHVSSHGSLYVGVLDISDRSRTRPVSDAELRFLNSAWQELAQAKAEESSGTIYLSQPASYSCHEIEKQAPFSPEARKQWSLCFEGQSRWLMLWVRDVKYVDLKSDSCRLQRIPVSVSETIEPWWIWWVPLPHIGGKPYTLFSIQIYVDRNLCKVEHL